SRVATDPVESQSRFVFSPTPAIWSTCRSESLPALPAWTWMFRAANSDERDAANAAPSTTTVPMPAIRACCQRAKSCRRRIEVPNKAHLRFETDVEAGRDEVLHLSDELEHVGGLSALRRDDEVRVLLGDARAADRQLLATRVLDQAGRVIPGRVDEDAPAVRLGERLGSSPPLPRLLHLPADVLGRPRFERKPCGDDDRVRFDVAPPVAE